MAGFIAMSNDLYEGTLKLSEINGVENGVFVVPNYATGVAALADATTGDGDVRFVSNEIDTILEDGIDDVNFVVANGEYLRLKTPQKGEILVTTNYNGVLAVGDVVAVGIDGAVETIGTRTPDVKFAVKELTTAYGTAAVKIVAL